jgi:hypothetical protein
MSRPIDDLFRRQHAVIIRPQALDVGMSRRQIDRMVEFEIWTSKRRGAYRLSAVPFDWMGELLELVLLTGGVASHRSAVRLHRLDGSSAGRPEITVDASAQRPFAGAVVHGSTQMDLFRPDCIAGIPVTPVARSLLDVAAVAPERLTQLVDDAIRKRAVTLPGLWDVLIRHAARGRNGTAEFRVELERRRAGDAVPLSMWSRWVADLIADQGLPKPIFEHPVHRSGSFVAQVDLAFPEWRVAIELDSISFHTRFNRFQLDPVRRNAIRNAGWHLVEVTWDLYAKHPLDLLATVRAALQVNGWPSSLPS